MNFVDQAFNNERIDLHGKSFRGCTFNNCELVYDGDRSPTFKDNKLIDTVFVFTGPRYAHFTYSGTSTMLARADMK